MNKAEDLRGRILLEALQQRLKELSNRLAGMENNEIKMETYENKDPEECLRVVMVRYYPKCESGNITSKERDEYLSLLLDLTKNALSDDLRFLDAFNNAFEVLTQNKIKDQYDLRRLNLFLNAYRLILRTQTKRLSDK